MAFSHLHVHTEYSLLDGMSTVRELFTRAKDLKMPALAITDHGTMMGVKDFYSYARQYAPDVKPIIGDEVYVTDGYDHRLKDDDHKITYHLILLAKNLTGYKNLCKIASIGAVEGFYRKKARVSFDVIREHHEGLICLSACIGGEVPQYILDDDLDGAEEVIQRYRDVFGEDYYLEVSEHPNTREGNPQEVFKMQRQTTDALLELGRKMGIKVVATNDSHFTYKEQAQAHDVMLAMNCGKTISDPTRLRFTGEEYLKSEDEMLAIFKDHPEVVWNTQEVCDKVELYNIDGCVEVPSLRSLYCDESPDSTLSRLVKEGFNALYRNNPEALQRVNYELSIIKKYGYAGRFLIWHDIVRYAKEHHIMLGPGRGTAPGSIVNYCLGITQLDPIEEGLLFEKFINPESNQACPIVDFDVEEGAVKELWEHLCTQYGQECVAGILSFDKPKLKELFPKVAAAMEISSIVIQNAQQELEQEGLACKMKRLMLDNPSLQQAFEIAKTLEGRKFGKRTSPCGITLSGRPIVDNCPVCLGWSFFDGSKIPLVQYEWYQAEETGLMRLNILYLKQLNVIKNTLNEIRENNLDNCVYDDKVADLMHNGDTDGVFLFESDGMKHHLQSFRRLLEEKDIVAMHALYRPGLLEKIHEYKMNVNSVYDRTGIMEFDESVEDTNGILTYQEQCILFFTKFLHYSPGKSVRMFRALSKYKEKDIAQLRSDFRNECKARGLKEKKSDSLWMTIQESAPLILPKSHILCYVRISVICAYLKAHYRDIYVKHNYQYGHDS